MQLIIANATKMKSQNANDVAAKKLRWWEIPSKNIFTSVLTFAAPDAGEKMNSKHAS
jgi:hypothetical protein